MKNSALERLLRAAAEAQRDQPNDMPFGFDTRVLASRPSGQASDLVGVGRLLRRAIVLSFVVIGLASAGIYHELHQSEESGEFSFDQYEIADSAISSAIEP